MDNLQRSKLEKASLLHMRDKDHDFYIDQKGPRKIVCVTTAVEPQSAKDKKFSQ